MNEIHTRSIRASMFWLRSSFSFSLRGDCWFGCAGVVDDDDASNNDSRDATLLSIGRGITFSHCAAIVTTLLRPKFTCWCFWSDREFLLNAGGVALCCKPQLEKTQLEAWIGWCCFSTNIPILALPPTALLIMVVVAIWKISWDQLDLKKCLKLLNPKPFKWWEIAYL